MNTYRENELSLAAIGDRINAIEESLHKRVECYRCVIITVLGCALIVVASAVGVIAATMDQVPARSHHDSHKSNARRISNIEQLLNSTPTTKTELLDDQFHVTVECSDGTYLYYTVPVEEPFRYFVQNPSPLTRSIP
jgi:hypothetical protein